MGECIERSEYEGEYSAPAVDDDLINYTCYEEKGEEVDVNDDVPSVVTIR